MAKKKTINVKGVEIALLAKAGEEDYISLTDIMKNFDDEFSIYSWLRNRNTIEFIGTWELLHNTDFKGNEFVRFKNESGANNFNLTPKKWITATSAKGMVVKSGRYGGGTFAHRDIAINFCYWLSPPFQLYLIKEFQRLKSQEQNAIEWNLRRTLAKVNYRIHTDAIKQNLVPKRIEKTSKEGMIYANEADLLNVALFGITAKQWRETNPDKEGNMRDHATGEQLLVLANLESHNAQFIKEGLSQGERLDKLNQIAIYQIQVLISQPTIKGLSSKD